METDKNIEDTNTNLEVRKPTTNIFFLLKPTAILYFVTILEISLNPSLLTKNIVTFFIPPETFLGLATATESFGAHFSKLRGRL